MKKRIFSQAIGLAISTIMGIVTLAPKALAEAEPLPYNCLTREVFTPASQAWCDRWQVLQDATYTVLTSLNINPEYTTVILENGRYQREDGRFFVELVNERNWLAFGDIN